MDKFLKKCKVSKLNIYEQLYKEAKITVQKLIKNNKRDFYQKKLKENIGTSMELWKALKSLGLPSKITPVLKFFSKMRKKLCLMKKQTVTS